MSPMFRHRLVRLPLLLVLLLPGPLAAAPARAAEYAIKAKVLRIIGGYVQWPSPDRGPADRPFVLGVLGSSPFGPNLEEACRGKSIQGRPIQVASLEDAKAAGSCDLLFICASEAPHLVRILALLKNKPVFLMGDSPGFARQGVMLTLLVDGDTLSMEVNLKAARAAGFDISPSFLAVAKGKTKLVESE